MPHAQTNVKRFLPLVIVLLACSVTRPVDGDICSLKSKNGTLQFQSPPNGQIFNFPLLRGLSVNIDCCLFGKTDATTITWLINGVPLRDSDASTKWVLSEQRQLLTTSEIGLYLCTATDGKVSISKATNITTQDWDPKCLRGTVGALSTDNPATDVYDVGLYTSVSLTCEAVFYCGDRSLVDQVQWFKIQEQPDSFTYSLPDSSGSLINADTGDWVNATVWYANELERTVVVRAVLNIRNVTKSDLYSRENLANNCSDNSSSACSSNQGKYHYQCAIALEQSGDYSQVLYNLLRNTRLHSFSAVTKSTGEAQAHFGDASAWKREAIIFGCLLGAFVVVVAIVALLYARYEWHILVYYKRLAIWARSRGKTKQQFAYDCYVACTREDELLVYDVLKEQLENRLGYRLCLPDRDFVIGAAIPEQIGNFIERSEFFLAIISRRFWTTDWCNLAMDMALRTNAKIIAVFILDSPKAKADKRPNVAQALKAPGCNEFVFRSWKSGQGHDSLALKLQYAIPRPRSLFHRQHEPEASATHSTLRDLQLPRTTA